MRCACGLAFIKTAGESPLFLFERQSFVGWAKACFAPCRSDSGATLYPRYAG